MVLSFLLTNNNANVIGITTITAPNTRLFKKLDRDNVIYIILSFCKIDKVNKNM